MINRAVESASWRCPICGIGEPHEHSAGEIRVRMQQTSAVILDLHTRLLKLEEREGFHYDTPLAPIRSARQTLERAFEEIEQRLAAPPADLVGVLAEVRAWYEAEKSRIASVHRYNARVEYARTRDLGSVDCNPEYQDMESARRISFGLLRPMYAALDAALSTKEGGKG